MTEQGIFSRQQGNASADQGTCQRLAARSNPGLARRLLCLDSCTDVHIGTSMPEQGPSILSGHACLRRHPEFDQCRRPRGRVIKRLTSMCGARRGNDLDVADVERALVAPFDDDGGDDDVEGAVALGDDDTAHNPHRPRHSREGVLDVGADPGHVGARRPGVARRQRGERARQRSGRLRLPPRSARQSPPPAPLPPTTPVAPPSCGLSRSPALVGRQLSPRPARSPPLAAAENR